MKKILLLALIYSALALVSCKQKKKPDSAENSFFPTLSIIRDQVAQVDTSLFSIKKIVYTDTTRRDTLHVKREDFRGLAADFLSLPDLSDPEYRDRYVEKTTYDTTLKRAIIILEPKNSQKEGIQREEILIRPDASGDRVSSIIIDYLHDTKDSLVFKRLLWQMDMSFQVSTTRKLPGQPESTTLYKVIWNEEQQ
jgi:hypothetical protein